MSDEAGNVERMKRVYASWNDTKGASVGEWMSLCADDVELRSLAAGSNGMEFTAACCSRGDLERYFAGLARDWSMNYYRIDEYVAQGDRVVAIGECSFTHRGTGKTVVTPKVDILRFRDGKAVALFELFDTAKALAATQ